MDARGFGWEKVAPALRDGVCEGARRGASGLLYFNHGANPRNMLEGWLDRVAAGR